MSSNKILALIGAALLFVGVFMPIVSMPLVGNINYFMNGRGDGSIILFIAAAAAGLAAVDRVRHVVWPGAAALAILAYTFFRFQSGLAEAKARMASELAGNPFRGLADAAVDSIHLQWGWAVLVLGAGLLVYSGVAAWRSGESHPTR